VLFDFGIRLRAKMSSGFGTEDAIQDGITHKASHDCVIRSHQGMAYTLSALPIVILTLQFVPLRKSANSLQQREQTVANLSKIGLCGEL
jgi:hypothetical protein